MIAQNINRAPLRLIISIIGIFYFFQLNAQEIYNNLAQQKVEFEHFGENHGVNRFINCVYRDSRGFLWFASEGNGLYKYDAYEFENFNYSYNDSASLIRNSVEEILYEDSAGDIWVRAGDKLHRYNRSTNNFTRFQHNPADPYSVNDGRIISVVEDLRGNIWIGSYGREADHTIGGLTMYEAESGKFIKYENGYETANSFGINGIISLLVDNSGALWIGRSCDGVERFVWDSSAAGYRFDKFKYASNHPGDLLNYAILEIVEDEGSIWFGTYGGGLLRYEKRKNEIKQYRIHPQEFHKSNIITILSLDHEGKLWLGTSGGLATFDRINDTIIQYCNDPDNPFSITAGPINSIVHDSKESSWILTNGNWYSKGINRFDPVTGKFFLYQHNPQDPASLSTNLINTLFVDDTGILWVGTFDRGIDKFDPKKRKFNLYQCRTDSPMGMPEGRIQVIFEDHRGVFWIGTHDYGLFRFDRKSGEISKYLFNPDNPGSINNNTILSICEGPPGILWMGGLGGLKKLDMETMEFRHFIHDPDDPNSISADHIMSIYRDNSGILWIGTLEDGLNLFDPETEKFEVYSKNSDNQEGFNANTIFIVYEDSNGTIWLGSNNGLIKYIPGKNGDSDKFLHYKHDDNNLNSISSNGVRTLVDDNSGNLWIGTDGGGLNKFNLENESFTVYTMEDGLPNNTIWGILIDEKGNLWISTDNGGLSRFNPVTEKFSNYDQSDGLQGSQFNFNAYYKSRSGEMFFAGDKGINYFYPDSVKNNPYVPPIVITDLKLYNKSVPINENSPLKKSITELGEIELKYNENFISFEFAALNFTNSHKNRYKYKMTGLDPDTVYSGTRRFADYTDMKPGDYTFWVTGSNNDGIWNEKGVSLHIVIHPPWWRSRLAYSLYIVFVILMVSGFIRWRTWSLRKDKEELEKQVRERTREIEEKDFHILEMDRMKSRFFTNISHEFRTPLTLILSPLEKIMADKNSKDKDYNELGVIRRNGLRLLDLVNQLLDLSKLDSGKLKLELMEADIIKILRLSFSSFISLADKKRIQYDFQLPVDEIFTYFDKGKLETIMNNLLSNAFKYTPEDGEIKCEVHIKETGKEGEKDVIEISVRDSGPGIDKNKLDLIFNRFYQADEEHHIEGGGTGIGLSLTKELVQLIHGEIKVISNPGKGSCFIVTIPLGKDHLKKSEYVIVKPELRPEPKLVEDILPDEISADSIKTESVRDKNTIQVLIVEDNRDLSAYLKEQLQINYLIEEASDGEEGLKKAIKNIPDLIITDIMMPKMDGVELCKRVKTNEKTSHIPVVLLTAKADIESRIEGLETGADDYIIKPFNMHELITRVKNLIEQRQTLRKRFAGNLNVTPKEIAFNSYDVQFINRIIGVVEEHLADFNFDVKDLQSKTGMSHTQLYRKLFALTGLSPSKFILTLRLKRATKLMEQKSGNVTKIAYEVGFNNLAYFAKCFKELYGVSPSGYLKQFSG